MADQKFRAYLSRSQGRGGWCVIFGHPLRTAKDGKPGLRVRRGLGTTDKSQAEALVDQLNRLLEDKEMWNPTERHRAERIYDPKIVSAFYDKISVEQQDPWLIRNEVIPLPDKDDGYAKVLLVGTTGSGKTTIVRQLIGTDPAKERFPSTSAAKTTISNIEIITNENGNFKAVVSFLDKSYVRQHIEECVISAILANIETKDEKEVENKFLVHSEQRFRLSYILGSIRALSHLPGDDEITDEEITAEDEGLGDSEIQAEEKAVLLKRLDAYLTKINGLAAEAYKQLAKKVGVDLENASKEEIDTLQELVEEDVYKQEIFQELVDEILDDVEERFDYLESGTLNKDASGWPTYWVFVSDDRGEFIRKVNRFSSNYAPNFGRLLTPLVEGIRISGGFKPAWQGNGSDPVRLVLMDGEGLGHTPESASSISTSITRRFQMADAILVVDNAAQPMQAAPTAVLQSLVSSGHHSKLLVAFTHFDEVKGDNLPNISMRKQHILDSYENSVSSVGKTLGPRAEKVLRSCRAERVFFLSNIQNTFQADKRSLTYTEFIKLISAINKMIEPPVPTEAVPIYDDSNVVLNIQKAAMEFHNPWLAKLKLQHDPNIKPEHWARVKALTRRLGELNVDEYDDLKPVADLISRLQIHLYLFSENPIDWKPKHAPDAMKQTAIDNITKEIDIRLHDLIKERLFIGKIKNWHEAYSHRGYGSTRTRAYQIKDIYGEAAPVPGEVPNSESIEFVKDIRDILRESIKTGGGELKSL
ncbi:MAG: hypothetical protein MUD09_00060 [Desulfobacterales bacterium]|jgi:GTPase Era involved in 16S rRNA processing|nr:hypothetical protein [Desulfobacterales bacterium]